MEIPILILDQQQTSVKAAVSNTSVNNAQQAGSGQKSNKSTFNKALDEATEKGTTDASSQSENESKAVKGEDRSLEDMLVAGSPPVAVFNVVMQPVIPAPATKEALSSVIGPEESNIKGEMLLANPAATTDKVTVNTPDMQAVITPAGMALQNASPNSLAVPVEQDGAQEIAVVPMQDSNPPVAVNDAKTGEVNSVKDQNLALPADMVEQPAVTVQTGSATVITKNSVKQAAEPGLQAQADVEPTGAALTESAVNPVKVEQPIEQKGVLVKESTKVKEGAFTSVVVPVAGVKEQLSEGKSFNSDTSGAPSTMTPMGAMQSAKVETVNTPFPAVEAQPPIREQVMQEIVQKARLMSNGTQQTMQMQLKPENLGPLNVQISLENGAVTAKFQTDNPQVKQALEASLNQLKQDLQAQGFKVQDVAVSIAQQGMSFSEFSRRSPQFGLVKSKRIGKVDGDMAEPSTAKASLIENYDGLQSSGVDFKV